MQTRSFHWPSFPCWGQSGEGGLQEELGSAVCPTRALASCRHPSSPGAAVVGMQLPHLHDSLHSLLRPRGWGGGPAPGRRLPGWYIKMCIISLAPSTVLKLSAHFLQTPEDKAKKGKGWSGVPGSRQLLVYPTSPQRTSRET